MTNYLIAFGGKPQPTFMQFLKDTIKNDCNNRLTSALMVPGPGCYNLGFTLERDDERLVEQLTMALMPARYSTMPDGQLTPGQLIDDVNLIRLAAD